MVSSLAFEHYVDLIPASATLASSRTNRISFTTSASRSCWPLTSSATAMRIGADKERGHSPVNGDERTALDWSQMRAGTEGE